MQILSVGAEQVHADGGADRQKDVMKLTVDSRNFANASKNEVSASSGIRKLDSCVHNFSQ